MEKTNIIRKVKRGEIYLYDFGTNPESIQNGVRPVLVVQCDEGNEASTTTIIAAMTPIESEKFLSMPKELARKYEEKFKYPERFYKSLDGIEAKPYKPVSKDMER